MNAYQALFVPDTCNYELATSVNSMIQVNALQARARSLRNLAITNYIQTVSAESQLFVFLPCSYFAEAMAYLPLFQIYQLHALRVFVVLVFRSDMAKRAALQKAARENLSEVFYFEVAENLNQEYFDKIYPYGSVLLLRRTHVLPADVLNQIVKMSCTTCTADVLQPDDVGQGMSVVMWRNVSIIDVAMLFEPIDTRAINANMVRGSMSERSRLGGTDETEATVNVGHHNEVQPDMQSYIESIRETGQVLSIRHSVLDRLIGYDCPRPHVSIKRNKVSVQALTLGFDVAGVRVNTTCKKLTKL